MKPKLSETEISDFIKKIDFDKMKGLVPVVVQDASNRNVLMQAFVNEEALRLTLNTGRMHYWSRDRGRIWQKGEESGHYSLVQNASLDCDNDAILFRVQQIGPVCHTGKETCFHKPIAPEEKNEVDAKFLEKIYSVVVDRIKNPISGSYVSSLVAKGKDPVLKKIGEEATELALAAKGDQPREVVSEAADLIFHTLIVLANQGIDIKEVFRELESRHKNKTKESQESSQPCH
jgi:phosphoribosyl-ATP pyrophosphohydrolase/phosphoribosyl-AMP cyclohydrolase